MTSLPPRLVWSIMPGRTAGGSSPRAPPWSARWRRPRGRTARCGRRRGGRRTWSPRPLGSGPSTACSPGCTSRARRTCACWPRSRTANCSAGAIGPRSGPGTCGTSSATCTCCCRSRERSGSLAPAMTAPRTTLLITLTGRDRPGVTSRLFVALAGHRLSVLDVEQVVIRGRLVLGVLLGCDGPPDLTGIHAAVTALAAELGLDAEMTLGSGDSGPAGGRLHVTLLGSPLAPAAVAAIAGRIAAAGANIDRIGRLAQHPVTCIEMDVSGGDPALLRADLARAAADHGIDAAVQRGGLHRRAMRGELDFAASLRERVALLAGLDAAALDDVRRGLRLTAGARTLIRTLDGLGYRSGIVSGGFIQVIGPLAAELGIGYVAANRLEIAAGKLTGRLAGPVIDRAGKADALRGFAADAGVPLSQTVAVGDGANDLDMIAAAGLGIAFNARPAVRDAADASLSVPYLDAILYLLGISSDDALCWPREDGSAPAPGFRPSGPDELDPPGPAGFRPPGPGGRTPR